MIPLASVHILIRLRGTILPVCQDRGICRDADLGARCPQTPLIKVLVGGRRKGALRQGELAAVSNGD